jgi:hypothetical protein
LKTYFSDESKKSGLVLSCPGFTIFKTISMSVIVLKLLSWFSAFGELILFGRCFGIFDSCVCEGHDGILAQSSFLAITGFEGEMTVFFSK